MKLNELKQLNESQFLTDKEEIKKWLEVYRMGAFPIRSNGIVDAHKNGLACNAKFGTAGNDIKLKGALPVKFGEVDTFIVAGHKNLTSIQGFPEEPCRIDMTNTGITSLVGIHEIVKGMWNEGEIFISPNKIKEGGIGLILILGLKSIVSEPPGTKKAEAPWIIIRKYLRRPEDIFECQTELIEAGLEEFAEL